MRELEEKVRELERSLAKKEKICRVLMNRVARSIDSVGGAYSIFERNILLQSLVDQRSKELEDSNRKLAQEITERSESEQRLWNVIQGSPIPTFVIGKDHRIIYWNKALEEMSCVRAAEVIGTNRHWRAFYGEARPCMADLLMDGFLDQFHTWYAGKFVNSRLIEGAYEATDFFPNLGSSGRWLRFTAAVMRDVEGAPIGAIETLEDITDQIRAEEKIKQSETWYRAIFENTGTAAVILDADTTIVLANAEYEKLSGFSKMELEGKMSWTEFVGEDDLDRMLESHRRRRTGENGATGSYEFSFVDRLGRIKHILLTVDMIPDTTRSVASLLDITERKIAEEALRKSYELNTKLIGTIPDVMLLTDISGSILFINDAALKTGGYSREDFPGKNIISFIDPGDHGKAIRNMRRMLDAGAEPEVYNLVLKDGSVQPFEANGSVLSAEDGSPYGFVFVCRDISERKRIEEARQRLEDRLRRAEKMEVLGTLAGGVAHDLNNVLGVLIGYSELLVEGLPEGNRLRKYASHILQSGQKGAAIIQDLLTLTRRGVAVSEVINLNPVVTGYFQTPEFDKLKEHYPFVGFKSILERNLLNIKGSPVHLEKTLMNLVSNAAESIKGEGEITIRTENCYLDRPVQGYDDVQEGDYAVLTVSDSGEGISAADIDRIFEPFFTKKVMGRSGTGLGLTVVWGTVKDHKGYIDVKTRTGRGTAFVLYFPVTREVLATARASSAVSEYMGKGESILVVDDMEGQRELAAAMLGAIGYQVSSVASGEEAVAYLSQNDAELVILDMIMDPGMDGLETYEKILKVKPGQKAIIVSGFSETDRVKKAQQLGAGRYVRKPYIQENIGLAVRKELDR
ncbi:MAG: PAS domain S-box protein [Syntrophaceae bacterium]